MEFQKNSERDNYHTYSRLHLPVLLNTIKNGIAQKYINTSNTSDLGLILTIIQTYFSCILGTWLCKEHHRMHVLGKVTGNNVTR